MVIAMVCVAAGVVLFLQASVFVQGLGLILALFGMAIVDTLQVAGPRVESLLRRHIDRDRYAARLSVRREGLLTGSDEGVIWFEGGLLCFEGAETAFEIFGREFQKQDRGPFGTWLAGRYVVEIDIEGSPTTLLFDVARHYPEGSSRSAEGEFGKALVEWSGAVPDPGKAAVLPPAGLRGEIAFSRQWRVWELQTAAVAVPFLCVALVMPEGPHFHTSNRLLVCLALGACLALTVGGLRCASEFRRRKYRGLFPDDPLWAANPKRNA
jgi:hypothetical protein